MTATVSPRPTPRAGEHGGEPPAAALEFAVGVGTLAVDHRDLVG
jgi:hypothetical protein